MFIIKIILWAASLSFAAFIICFFIVMRKLWLYKLARQLADDEVTHGQFFGENISRTVNTLSKKTGILRPMETIQISEDVTLQFNNTPAPVVIESAGNEVQLS